MVQLTEDLRARLDQEAHRHGVSRSQLIRDALWAYLEDDERARQVQQFRAAYAAHPETEVELADATANARAMLEAETW